MTTDLCEFYTKKGETAAGRPYAIVFEFAPSAHPGEKPIRILGRYEDDFGDYTKLFIDRDPEGGYARRQERPFTQGGPIALALDMHSPSPWLLLPPAILDCLDLEDDPRPTFLPRG